MNKQLTTKQAILVLLLPTILIVLVYAGLKFNEQTEIKKELVILSQVSEVWNESIEKTASWDKGEMTRDELAVVGVDLLNKLYELKEVKNSEDYVIDILDSVFSNTEVMIFDMVRGFELEGNKYADRSKMEDDVLKYVYPKRDKSYKRTEDFIIDYYQNNNKNAIIENPPILSEEESGN